MLKMGNGRGSLVTPNRRSFPGEDLGGSRQSNQTKIERLAKELGERLQTAGRELERLAVLVDREINEAASNRLRTRECVTCHGTGQTPVSPDVLSSAVCRFCNGTGQELPVTREPIDESASSKWRNYSPIRKKAIEWLDQLIPPGTEMAASDVFEAMRAAGFSETTLKTVKPQLNIRSIKDGLREGWYWYRFKG